MISAINFDICSVTGNHAVAYLTQIYGSVDLLIMDTKTYLLIGSIRALDAV